MADKKIKCVVLHPKLNLAVGGKLQRVEKGSTLDLTEEQIKRMNGRVVPSGDVKNIELAGKSDPAAEAAEAHAKAAAKAAKTKK